MLAPLTIKLKFSKLGIVKTMKDKKIINSWRQQEATTMKTNEGLSHGDILQKHLQEIQVHEEIKKKTNPLSLFLSFFFLFFLFQ